MAMEQLDKHRSRGQTRRLLRPHGIKFGFWRASLTPRAKPAEVQRARGANKGAGMKKYCFVLCLTFCLTGLAPAENMIEAAGSVFINSAGEKKEAVLSGKIVGFYFANEGSACTSFTRKLIDFYSNRKQAECDIEIIHVSASKSAENMLRNMRNTKMPWPASPHGSKESADLIRIKRKGSLGTLVPVLIIVRDGQIITELGRQDVQELGLKAYEKWLTMAPENAAFQDLPTTPSESNRADQEPQPSDDEKNLPSKEFISSPADFEALRKKASDGSKQDQDNYFNLCAKYIHDSYDSIKTNRYIVESYKSKEEIISLKPSPVLRIETFLNNIPPPASPENGAVVTTSNNLQVAVEKIYSDDTKAVFIADGPQQKRVSISELPASSQLWATALVANQLFERKFEIAVNKGDSRTREGSSTPKIGGAKESYTYTETPYNIVLANKSGAAIDSLIVEYQIFFKQTLPGKKLDDPADYRFVGHKVIKTIPADGNFIINVIPPPIIESKLVGGSIGTTATYLYYPTDCYQTGSGRIRGIWVRVHRITPYGRLTADFKDGVYPTDAEWAAIEVLQK